MKKNFSDEILKNAPNVWAAVQLGAYECLANNTGVDELQGSAKTLVSGCLTSWGYVWDDGAWVRVSSSSSMTIH